MSHRATGPDLLKKCEGTLENGQHQAGHLVEKSNSFAEPLCLPKSSMPDALLSYWSCQNH